MALDPITSLFEIGKTAIEKIWPDANKRAEEIRKLEELRQSGDLARFDGQVKLLLAQVGVNLEEAKSKSLFVAGWRPATGWVCVLGLFYQFVIREFFLWAWPLVEIITRMYWTKIPDGFVFPSVPPSLDTSQLMTLLLGMLGLAITRAVEGVKGVKSSTM
jgi:hypothetical protein